jgi:O-methyltransferase
MRRAGIAMIRLDGDLYASTRDALAALYPLLRRGGLVYVDDYGSFPGCARAIDEYRNAHGISAKLHSIDEGNGRFEAVYWQKR